MSLFSKAWTWDYEGQVLEVRQISGQEYVLVVDGSVVDTHRADRNMGKRYLRATIAHDGKEHRVEAVATQGAFTETVSITVGGVALLLKQ